jgi:hypothetical protein
MPIHLIKLCVGVSEAQELSDWCARERPVMHTKQTPRRAEDLLEGGSLYWVIKGTVLVRQTIVDIKTIGAKGATRCLVSLGTPVMTAPMPRRAFQGWRYLTEADAPPDLAAVGGEDIPLALAKELRELGAW